jgi:DNA-binding winged helix-turn-helix (wHTH) protein
MLNGEPHAVADAVSWRFADFELDGERRILTHAGAPVHLTPRAFEVLLHLVRHHRRMVPRAELLAQCWPQREVTDGVVARTMMSLRTALSGGDPQRELIQTMPRVGYRLVAPVLALAANSLARFEPPSPADGVAAPAGTVRLAVLPVDNRSAEPRLAWVEFGLASLLGAHLEELQIEGIAHVRQVLVALKAMPAAPHADPALCAQVLARALGARAVLGSRLDPQQGHCALYLTLHGDGALLQQGTVLADDLGELAQLGAALVARWLAQPDGVATPDLGDAFLNETWQRVLRRGRDDNLLEVEHLVEVLRDAGADAPDIDLEHARIALLLGRPHASQALQWIEARAARLGGPHLQIEALLLQVIRLEQQGRTVQAMHLAREAATRAAGANLLELQWRASVMCARQAAASRAEAARELLAQTIRHAERWGNRILLRDACTALGDAAAIEGDWVGALRHHAMGLATAQTLHESARAVPLCGLSQARLQLGQLREAQAIAVEALRCARLTGAQAAQGRAALALADALHARRETGALRELLSTLDALTDDQSAAMQVARESRCRAALLRLAGRHDDALACIAQARHASRRHPVLAAICVQDRLQVLLAARRFDEVQALCRPLLAARTTCLDARLVPWLELAMACSEHALQADPGIALRRLDALLARRAASQAHALAGLAAMWIELDAGRVAQAAARAASGRAWTEQCPVGSQVEARLLHALGAAAGARSGDLPWLLWQAA